RNGQRMIIIKPRASRTDANLVEYPTYDQTPMRIPDDLPPGRAAPLPSAPKTVVPLVTQQPTASQEHPSAIVAINSVKENPAASTVQGSATTITTHAVVEE